MTVVCFAAAVLGVDVEGRVRVRSAVPPGEVVATWALPFRYVPEAGDVLQVLGQGDRYWVTGIVSGRGRAALAFHGGVQVGGPGTLRLAGGSGVRVVAPEVVLRAAALERDVGGIVQRVGAADEQVVDTCVERAGQVSRMIEGSDATTAGRVETVARGSVRIDGDLLQLG